MTSSASPRRAFLHSLALGGASAFAFGATPLAKLPTVDEETRRAAESAALRLLFRGKSPADLTAWQQEFSAELRNRLGSHAPPARWSASMLARTEFSEHVREEWLLSAAGVPDLPLYILKPAPGRHGPGPFPIVVAVHGHGEFGHDAVVGIDDSAERVENIRRFNYDFGRQLVREGYLVVAPCLTPFGRRLDESYRKSRADPCAITFVRLMLLGQTLIGANLRDVKWALSYALSRDDARRGPAGCVGLSYGGRMTMLMTALDDRIAVAVVSGALNVMQERVTAHYGCGGQVIPRAVGDRGYAGNRLTHRAAPVHLGGGLERWIGEARMG